MNGFSDSELYLRGAETLVASWEVYAHSADDAQVLRAPGVIAAIFPNEPERSVYNNALLSRDLAGNDRIDALDVMETAYAAAGVAQFAAWVHEDDAEMRDDLERRGYRVDSWTRAMGMALSEVRSALPEIELGSLDWREYCEVFGLPPGLLATADHSVFNLVFARFGGEVAATAMAFDHDGDCGIYNVATLEHARKRGLGTGLTNMQLLNARSRGCQTASLQSTPMAESVYAAAGFRDLGRIIEYVPGA